MKNANNLISALTYVLLIVVAEVILFYLARSFPFIGEYAMLLTTFVFLGLAWVLKLKVPALIISVVLTAMYGVLSFYSDFPIYHVGYPATLEEFLSVIGIKTAFYTFPLIAYLAVTKK